MDFLNLTDPELNPGWLVGYNAHGELVADFVLKAAYDLVHDGVAVPAISQPFVSGDEPEEEHSTALRYTRDLTASKPAVDLLLVGTARAPGGKPVTMLPVRFRVGNWEKTLAVLGDRIEKGGLFGSKPGETMPFTAMPLTWSRAAGGSESRFNPHGRGLDKTFDETTGKQVVWLPNVVAPADANRTVGKNDLPQGFGPVSPDWAQRHDIARRASFGNSWLSDTWPGPPSDFDWSYFNAALPDQRVALGSIAGNEPIELHNLHPDLPVFRSQLPAVRPRWFLGVETDEQPWGFREVDLQIDTLWVDADAARLILLWRGQSVLLTKGMKEIKEIVIATEPMSEEAKPASHYQALLEEKKQQRAEEMAVAEAEAEKAADEAGLPPVVEEVTVEPPNDFDWAAWEQNMEDVKAEALGQLEKAQQMADESLATAASGLEANGIPTDVLKVQPNTDPTAGAQSAIAAMEAFFAANPDAAALMPPDFELPTADQLDANKILEKTQAEFDAKFAEPITPEEAAAAAAPPEAGEAPAAPDAPADGEEEEEDEGDWTRDKVSDHIEEWEGATFEGEDLRDLDLSNLDFTGVTFTDCAMDRCNLATTVLTDARFIRCTLPHAVFIAARIRDTTFQDCDLMSARFAGCTLERAILDGSQFARVNFDRVTLSEVTAGLAGFYRASFVGCTLDRCTFTRSDMEQVTAEGVNWGGSSLEGVNAYGLQAPGASFAGCNLTNFRVGDGANLSRADFTDATAPRSAWEDTMLDEAVFRGANLAAANFASASLASADFTSANLSKARLPEANLRGATLVQANLFRASLENAIILDADLRGANLYECEFLETAVTGAAFDGANIKGTKLA